MNANHQPVNGKKLSALKSYDEPQNDEHTYIMELANIYDEFSIHERSRFGKKKNIKKIQSNKLQVTKFLFNCGLIYLVWSELNCNT